MHGAQCVIPSVFCTVVRCKPQRCFTAIPGKKQCKIDFALCENKVQKCEFKNPFNDLDNFFLVTRSTSTQSSSVLFFQGSFTELHSAV